MLSVLNKELDTGTSPNIMSFNSFEKFDVSLLVPDIMGFIENPSSSCRIFET